MIDQAQIAAALSDAENEGWPLAALPRTTSTRSCASDARCEQIHPDGKADISPSAGHAPKECPDNPQVVPLIASAKAARLSSELWIPKIAWTNRRAFAAMAKRIEQLEKDKLQLQADLRALTLREAASNHDASHDALTGLPNRILIRDRFQQAAARAERFRTQLIVLFLDLDQFKQVNDSFSHAVGDRVLQMVAGRISAIIRATDTACRYGGDEFVILLTDLDEAARPDAIAQNMRKQLALPCRIGSFRIALQASIGAAVYPSDGMAWEHLLAHADAAMYRAKGATANSAS